MPVSLILSVAFHLAVIIVAVVGLPRLTREPVAPQSAIPVQVVTVADVSTALPSNDKAEPKKPEPAAQEAGKTEPREAPPEPPPAIAEKPKPPVPEVAAVPPPPAPRPPAPKPPEAVTAEPKPPAPAPPAPKPPEAVTAEPKPPEPTPPKEPAPPKTAKPVRSPDPVPPEPEQPKAVATAQPTPKVAATKAKPRNPAPLPKPKPDRPEPVQTAETEPEPEKPKPRPVQEAKPKKQDDFKDLESLVDNLKKPEPIDRPARKSPSDKSPNDLASISSALESRNPRPITSSNLTISEIDALRRQLEGCWIVPAGAKNAENLAVDIRVRLDQQGDVKSAEIVDRGRMASDGFFRAAAESAQRAVYKCSPLKVPSSKFSEWQEMTLTFDPKDFVS